MIPALRDLKPLLPTLAGNAIHQPVLAEDAAAAPALQGMLQRCGVPRPLNGTPLMSRISSIRAGIHSSAC
jgi:hypothetical protein